MKIYEIASPLPNLDIIYFVHIKCYHVSTNVHFLFLRKNSSLDFILFFYFTLNFRYTFNQQALILVT